MGRTPKENGPLDNARDSGYMIARDNGVRPGPNSRLIPSPEVQAAARTLPASGPSRMVGHTIGAAGKGTRVTIYPRVGIAASDESRVRHMESR
jgi:hypothetical protein